MAVNPWPKNQPSRQINKDIWWWWCFQATHPSKKQRLSKPQRDTRPKQMPEGVFPTKFKQKLKHLPSPIRCPRPLSPFSPSELEANQKCYTKERKEGKGNTVLGSLTSNFFYTSFWSIILTIQFLFYFANIYIF